MQTPGHFESANIPATIKDAIQFTRGLGMDYLWVDALCIIQDSEDDKAVQISRMSEIYSNAFLTLAACDGASVDSGLPGVSMPRTATQIEVGLPKSEAGAPINLLTSLSPQRESFLSWTNQCSWSKRAWTLQEQALSKRMVLFMNQQIFWRCGTAGLSEELALETRLATVELHALGEAAGSPWTLSLHFTKDGDDSEEDRYGPDSSEDYENDPTRIWSIFELLVRSFGTRQLTYPGDRYDAFGGILDEISKRQGAFFLWGLDAQLFESCLCWLPTAKFWPSTRVECLTTRKMTSLHRRVPLPSWSWMGWTGFPGSARYDIYQYVITVRC